MCDNILETLKSKTYKNEKINTKNWYEFNLIDLFDITGTTTTPKTKLDLDTGGNFPYITTAAYNNGVVGYSNLYTEEGNVLTVDSAVIGTCLYQEYNFTASDHVEKLVPKFKLTKKIGLYLSTIINANGRLLNYAYNEKRSQTSLKKEKIYLPIKSNRKPDWKYMEKYIDSLPFSDKI